MSPPLYVVFQRDAATPSTRGWSNSPVTTKRLTRQHPAPSCVPSIMTEHATGEIEGGVRPLEYRKWEGLRVPRIWTLVGLALLIIALSFGWWGWRKYSRQRAAQAVEA